MKTVSLASIVADYRANKLRDELVGDWGSVVFYRLPASTLAWAAATLGITPTQLTAAGALMVPLIALSAWFLQPATAMAVVVALALMFNVLDCADGQLARATGTSSLSGRYLDFATDIAYRTTAYASLGLIADHIWPGAAFPWLAVGLCCGFLATYARLNRIYAGGLWAEVLEPQQPPGAPGKHKAFDTVFSVLSGLDTLLPLLAFLAWTAGLLWAAMIWFLLYTLGDAAVEVIGNYRKAQRIDAGGTG
ncbi:CDP-alcohol phosphatidyltransferase family protein [Aestuariivirga sp.]|uniref:CDP-alcohol phosphatidyltransferase family protein n=1 Tax=Aestuariivirga sp. TaxID=2650926 RepID=UPI0025BA9925|nr:CDP-alcohol phosphatidyltransferase family protein [Aestuariivirga sp.]